MVGADTFILVAPLLQAHLTATRDRLFSGPSTAHSPFVVFDHHRLFFLFYDTWQTIPLSVNLVFSAVLAHRLHARRLLMQPQIDFDFPLWLIRQYGLLRSLSTRCQSIWLTSAWCQGQYSKKRTPIVCSCFYESLGRALRRYGTFFLYTLPPLSARWGFCRRQLISRLFEGSPAASLSSPELRLVP